MFLKYLSDRDYEEDYWSFVLRFESLVAGIVSEISKRAVQLSDQQLKEELIAIFSRCLDSRANAVPPDWWKNVNAPTLNWFRKYLVNELPWMLVEIRRLEKENHSNERPSFEEVFDKVKIRKLAHESKTFRTFIAQYKI